MISGLIELIESIRANYGEMQDRSFMGQSNLDRQSRRMVNTVCVVLIGMLVLAGVVWIWTTW